MLRRVYRTERAEPEGNRHRLLQTRVAGFQTQRSLRAFQEVTRVPVDLVGTPDLLGTVPAATQPGSGFVKPAFWTVFGLMTISVFVFTSLPMLRRTHPLHDLLYSQRWLLFPHIAAGMTALAIGPLQFSRRLRQGNIARHRCWGRSYVAAVVVAAVLAPVMAWDYPAFFPYSAATQSCAWLVTTGAAFLTARNRHIEQHRRWMARSYAVGSVSCWCGC